MEKEFNLSEHIWTGAFIRLTGDTAQSLNVIPEEDVKEFIRLLKERLQEIWNKCKWIDCDGGSHDINGVDINELEIIDKLAGEALK